MPFSIFEASDLVGPSITIFLLLFGVGVVVAYLIWGIRCADAESSLMMTDALNTRTEVLTQENETLREKIQLN